MRRNPVPRKRNKRGEAHYCIDKGWLKLHWTYQGKKMSLMRGWSPDNPVHVRFVEQLRLQITNDLATGNFDPTLAKYDPKPKPKVEDVGLENTNDLWEKFKAASATRVAITTQKRYWGMCDKALSRMSKSALKIENARTLKIELLKIHSPTLTKRILQMLRSAFNWATKEDLIPEDSKNPFSKLQAEIKEASSDRARQAFTEKEAEEITTRMFNYNPDYDCFVRFLFATGCRPEEAIALTWSDIKEDYILIDKAYSQGCLKCTKTGKSRRFPLSDNLRRILRTQEEKTERRKKNSQALVFLDPKKGGYIDLASFTTNQWKPQIKKLVEEGKISEYLPTYHCRHTFITRQLRAGYDVATIAKWVGNSPEVILRHYAAASKEAIPV